jgi:FXSXX-COOH protein
VPKHGRGTSGGAGPQTTRTALLPDLGGVDLHELRGMDDPALLAAVDEVLRSPERFTESWWADSGQGGNHARRHSVPSRPGAGREGA